MFTSRSTSALRRALTRATVLFIAAHLAGCSWLFVDKPQQRLAKGQIPSCTTSNAWPYIDTALGGLHLAAMAASIDESGETSETTAANAIWAIVHAAAAWTGFSRTSDCRDAIARAEVEIAEQQRRDSVPIVPVATQPAQAAQPAAGSLGAMCFPNQTCNNGQSCDSIRGVCVAGPSPGSLGGSCYRNATCDAGLECDPATRTCSVLAAAGTRGGQCLADGTCANGLTCHTSLYRCVAPPAQGRKGGGCCRLARVPVNVETPSSAVRSSGLERAQTLATPDANAQMAPATRRPRRAGTPGQ